MGLIFSDVNGTRTPNDAASKTFFLTASIASMFSNTQIIVGIGLVLSFKRSLSFCHVNRAISSSSIVNCISVLQDQFIFS